MNRKKTEKSIRYRYLKSDETRNFGLSYFLLSKIQDKIFFTKYGTYITTNQLQTLSQSFVIIKVLVGSLIKNKFLEKISFIR